MKIIRFGELYSIPTSNGVSRPSAVRGEGFHMINMGELFSFDVINEMPMERVFLSDKEQKTYLVKKGDLLFARQSLVAAGAGKCSIVNNILEPTTFESHLIRVRLDETRCCPRYYYYLFKLPDNPIKTIVNQCAQAGIRGSELQKIKVPLPMLAEQRRIASILSTYDNLIENNNKRIRLLEQMAENLYKEWFVRFRFPGHEKAEFENGLPKGWVYAKLEDILSLKDSVRIPLSSLERSNMQKKYPYYGAASILDYVDDYLFDGVYLLLGEDGSVIDENGYPYIQYVWGRFWVNNHAHVIEKKGVYSVEFLYCLFKRMNIQSVVTGVAQPKISQGRLFNKKVIKPCDSIISLFDKQIQPIFAGIRQLTEENNNLSRQRDLLLPRLMSGKLEVNV